MKAFASFLLGVLASAGTIYSATSSAATRSWDNFGPMVPYQSRTTPAEIMDTTAPGAVLLDPKVGENIRMGEDPPELPPERRAQAEPHIARSWTDPNLVVAMFQEGRFETGGAVGNGYAVSTNGGLTWSRAPLPNTTQGFGDGPFSRATDPVVAFDHLGRVFLNSLAFNFTIATDAPPSQILVHMSTDGGQTFAQPFSAYTDNWPSTIADKNWLAIDTWPASPHQGRIAVSFGLFGYDPVLNRNTDTEILNTYSDDGGQSWSPPVSMGPTNNFGAQPLYLPDGSLAVCYWRFDGGFTSPFINPRIEVVVSPDGGTTFGDPTVIVPNVTLYDDSTTRDGVWLVSAATDRLAGVMYLTYQALVANTPRILFTKSIDQGQSWTAPVVVNDTPAAKSVFNPAIAASPDGQHVTIIFYDKRDGATPDYVDLYLAESFDGGDTWKPNVRLSNISSDLRLAPVTARGPMLGDYQGITPALNFDAPAVAAWIDTRTGSPDPFGVRIQRVEGTTFETWRKLRYSPEELADPSISGESADQEGDGIKNLWEYVYATEPDVPSPSPLKIEQGMSPEEGITVTYERLAVIRDLDFMWLASENLSDWSEVEPLSQETRPADNPILERVETRFAVNQPYLFLRPGARVVLRIDQHPQSQSAAPGETVEFSVTATGTGPLVYQWQLDGTNLVAATNATLIITNVLPADTGIYTVVVQDDYGSITSDPAILTVLVRPIIVEQPQSQTVHVGDTVVFSVTVTNTATLPIMYQWRKNFITRYETQVLPLRSSTITITNVQATHAGSYLVVVTNAATSASGLLSNSAELVVLEE